MQTRPEGWLDRFIFREYETSLSTLGLYRIVFPIFIFAFLFPRYMWIARFPDSFFSPPPGPMLLFTGFPPLAYFQAVLVAIVFSCVFLLFGRFTRTASFGLAASILAGNLWDYSFGKINHDILLVIVPLVMGFSGWGGTYSLDAVGRPAPAGRIGWPLSLLALLIGCAMCYAGLAKLRGGWLDPYTQATQGQLVFNYFVMERRSMLASFAMTVQSRFVWESADIGTVLLETGFLLAAFRRSAFRVFLSAACLFHLSIKLVLNIAFWTTYPAYAAFVNWSLLEKSDVFRRLVARLGWLSRVRAWQLFVLSCAISYLAVTDRLPNASYNWLAYVGGASGLAYLCWAGARAVRTRTA